MTEKDRKRKRDRDREREKKKKKLEDDWPESIFPKRFPSCAFHDATASSKQARATWPYVT